LFSLSPRYTAEVTVEINPRQTNVVDFAAVLSGLPTDSTTIETELRIIQSRKIARRAIARLQLNRDPEFNPVLNGKGLISGWLRGIGTWLSRSFGSTDVQDPVIKEQATEAEKPGLLDSENVREPGFEQQIKREEDQVITTFLARLDVTPMGRSRVIRVTYESRSPETAAAAANAVVDFYIVYQLEKKFEAAKRATTWLGERVTELRAEVEAKERAIEEYRSKSGLLQGGRNVTLTDEKVSSLNTQHVLELARLAEAEARLRQVNNLQNSEGGIESAVEVLQSPLVRSLRQEEARVERLIAENSEEYGERHPTMISARAELRDLRAKIQLEINRVIQGLRNEVAIVHARAATIVASLEQAKAQVAKLNQSEVQLRALERDATASRTLLENLLQRTKQTTSQETFQEADASVISYAAVPTIPSFPKKKIILPLLFVAAIILGILLAFALEKLDQTFRSAEQVARLTGCRSLGLLPLVSKLTAMGKAPAKYIVENPGSAYGEAIRTLYTNVLLSDVVNRPKVLLIASALPQEGKTSLAISMARLLASVAHRVIVVDCDFRQAALHKEMNLEPGPGLANCLEGGVSVDDVIQEDPLSSAHVLQAGTMMQNSPEKFDSQLMEVLLRHLQRKYDLVILDSAPILAVSDTLFIARLADKTIFLTRWARTKQATTKLALERVIEAQADVAGVLLTMVDVKLHAQYSYGDSGSYYGTLKKYYAS
jgi:capsular exopolysaccharide synthesis family protein